MADGLNLKKVASVKVYENKNEVKAFGFMVGDENTPIMEIDFHHLWGETNLSTCKLRWVLVDDIGSLMVGEVPINGDNKAVIRLPNELFASERRMKVQLTLASKDGSKVLNLQQFTDLKILNHLTTDEIVRPLYGVFVNKMFNGDLTFMLEEIEKIRTELNVTKTELEKIKAEV